MSLSYIKNKTLKLINKFGYDITKVDSTDEKFPIINENLLDPNKIQFLAESNKLPFLCYVPISYLSGHVMNFSFDKKLNHPFKKAIEKALKKEKRSKIIKSELKEYYENTQPQNAAEVLGLDKTDAPELFEKEPWVAVHPWENRTIEQVENNRPNQTFKENKKNGANIGIDEGWHLFGPVSEDKLNVEVERLVELLNKFENIEYKAYQNRNNITATILIDDKKSQLKWVVYDGQHRTSILSALDYHYIPVLVDKIVSRKNVKYWPGVKAGDFTEKTALKIFDKIMNEIPSPSIQN